MKNWLAIAILVMAGVVLPILIFTLVVKDAEENLTGVILVCVLVLLLVIDVASEYVGSRRYQRGGH